MNYRIPRLAATIERRLLINYRLDPGVAQSLLPENLRPQLVDGRAVAGICLIRLGDLRPAWLRPRVGWRAENAAHRIAVEWDDADGTHAGVYIPIRHSASWLPVAVGGRLFPGVHRHARFSAVESERLIEVKLDSEDTRVEAEVAVTQTWTSSLFATLDDASRFFQAGSIGWSPSRSGQHLDGLELATTAWQVDAGRAVSVSSSFFDALPAGAAELDCVLVMRNVPVTWSVPAAIRPTGQLSPSA